MKAAILVFGILLLACGDAAAWSAGGHKAIALIAWQQLEPAERAKVASILSKHPRWREEFAMPPEIAGGRAMDRERWVFAQASIWPDMVRDVPEYHRGSWHYINEPLFLNAADEANLAGRVRSNRGYAWEGNPEAAQNGPQTVDRALKVLRDASSSGEEKALMMSWLFHAVGDLHQPLHCVAFYTKSVFRFGDQGGNMVELRTVEKPRDRINLHAFWDRLLKGDRRLNEAAANAQSIMATPGMVERAKKAATEIDPRVWVREGWKLADEKAYVPAIREAIASAEADTGYTLPVVRVQWTRQELDAYGRACGAVAAERAAIAGYRLAEVLKRAVK